jgi:heme/copper-type cytochrome/quinol oxidase subunit 2
MKSGFIILSLLCVSFVSFSQIDTVFLYIESGTLELANNNSAQYIVFAKENTFQRNSSLIIKNQGQNVCFKVQNNDSQIHGFEINELGSIPQINPGEFGLLTVLLDQSGVFRYFDPVNSPYFSHIGLSGTLHVKDDSDLIQYYYWDIREHRSEWNQLILSGGTPDLLTYDPNQFAINGNIHDGIESDTLAKIHGNVGQEFRLVLVNHGFSIHSMHFHGYHGIILNSSKSPSHVGREKDSFPIYPMEYLVLSFTPDKPGEYPVHDHNLVAVTSGGIYHAGMITTLVIEP